MFQKHKYDLIIILSMLGFADSVYLTVSKALGVTLPCTITHGCEAVLSSKYSAVMGVSLGTWGIVFFSGIIITALLANHYRLWRKLLSLGLGIGSLGALVLLMLQFFVIKQVCQYCLLSDLLIIILFILDLNLKSEPKPVLGEN